MVNVKLVKANLVDSFKKLSHFVGGAKSHNLYQSVKIEATSDNTLVLTVTNENYTTLVDVIKDVDVISAGTTVINFKVLNDFIKKSKASHIELMQDGDVLKVLAGNINYKVDTTNAEDFPTLPVLDFNHVLNIDTNEYKKIISNTTYACATSDSRPTLQGVNVRTINNKLRFVATDSHRLGLYDIDTVLQDVNVILDGVTLDKSVKLLSKQTQDVNMSISTDFTVLSFDDTQLYIKHIDGNYPDTSRLLPGNFTTNVTIDSAETLESVNMLETITKQDRNNTVKLFVNGSTVLSDINNKMEATLQSKKYGDDMMIGFNVSFFKEAVKAINTKHVTLNLADKHKPFTITNNDSNAVHLILPVRLVK